MRGDISFHAVEGDLICKLACILQIRDCLEFVALLRSELAEDDQQLGGMPLLLQQSGTRQRILNHSHGFLWPSQGN